MYYNAINLSNADSNVPAPLSKSSNAHYVRPRVMPGAIEWAKERGTRQMKCNILLNTSSICMLSMVGNKVTARSPTSRRSLHSAGGSSKLSKTVTRAARFGTDAWYRFKVLFVTASITGLVWTLAPTVVCDMVFLTHSNTAVSIQFDCIQSQSMLLLALLWRWCLHCVLQEELKRT